MSKRRYRCTGCGATLEARDDLTRRQGRTRSAWFCGHCETAVPGIVGEKLRHQE